MLAERMKTATQPDLRALAAKGRSLKFADRRTLAAAYEWRREREVILCARIRIDNSILRSLRTELAELRQLEGQRLAARYLWESPAELEETMRARREFHEELRSLGVRAYWRAEFSRDAGLIA
jgi:hypothetical protein